MNDGKHWIKRVSPAGGRTEEVEQAHAGETDVWEGWDSLTFVWICDLCGQPLESEESECSSGVHVGPSGQRRGKAIRSTDLAEHAREAGTLHAMC